MDFTTRYHNLNSAQRSAVDTIEGPVMVVAGPGTGKTELLSMRAANILKQTDALPENILCLTFTESGSVAMKKRLTEIIGRDAYNVSIYTFHAFGSEIMSRHREYFYSGAEFRPADNLSVHRIITTILDSLPHNDPLRSSMNGKYTALGDIIKSISDLKRASLSADELDALLDSIDITLANAGPLLTEVFCARISKSTRDAFADAAAQILQIGESMPLDTLQPLSEVLALSMQRTLLEADQHPKVTPPLTAWKKEWMTTDATKTPILKSAKHQPKLRSLAHIYRQYLATMQEAELIDFDDMIMQVVQAVESHPDLRYELQEKYHYIMVDEFQDTNLAQMRILRNLTNNPIVEDSPNILVVGDDDQAIYGFQGADVGNIIQFNSLYPKTTHITLRDNYRSVAPVLTGAREVIVQAGERLEATQEGIDKTLTPHTTSPGARTEIVELTTPSAERNWIAQSIVKLIQDGAAPEEIAIIARRHSDLVSLISYLNEHAIPLSYDRRDNVLDDEAVRLLEHIGKVVVALAKGDHIAANALLPELLSHPAWNVAPTTLWEIGLSASKERLSWLETMRRHEDMQAFWHWLQAAAKQSLHLPLERMVDVLLGSASLDVDYVSPLRDYFFPASELERDPSKYIIHLENLTAIRNKLREHEVDLTTPVLSDLLHFIQQNRDTDTHITSLRHVGQDTQAVRLLSAHSSKGLEFNHVFIVNATDAMWGEKARGRSDSISYPPNLRLQRSANTYDERLRLFYVAMTRARHTLHISYAQENESAKEMLRAGFLFGNSIQTHTIDNPHAHSTHLTSATHAWYEPVLSIPESSMQEYLAPLLANYKLSATHVNAFIDIVNCGPQLFLLQSLLRFPSSPSPHANYGTAIHTALQRAHDHLRAHKTPQPEEDILHEFEKALEHMPFTPEESHVFLQKGSDALRAFLANCYHTFSSTQHAELNFSYQDVWLGEAHLTGKLDVVEFDKDTRSATVIDYKTGGALTSWDKGAEYQKIKAHKYRQQLLFYKLLIENSREWRNYTMTRGILQFVEPNKAGEIVALELADISHDELERFSRLVQAVWRRIQSLDFPDTSSYDTTLAGIRQFEEDLLHGTV